LKALKTHLEITKTGAFYFGMEENNLLLCFFKNIEYIFYEEKWLIYISNCFFGEKFKEQIYKKVRRNRRILTKKELQIINKQLLHFLL
jgi:hypothetical protein